MDFIHPLRTTIPGAQGRILETLANSTGELNLRTLARLSHVSAAQASRLLPNLVTSGIVERRETPPSAQYLLNREHTASRAIVALAGARNEALNEMRGIARGLPVKPKSIVIFGSFARGEADAASNIDTLIVRADGIDESDETWLASQETWRTRVRKLTGNAVEILEASSVDASSGLANDKGVWRSIRRDGVVVFGSNIAEIEALG